MVDLIVQLVSGAVGGNVAGAVMKKFSLGTIGNSIVGILGGGLGGQILSWVGIGVTQGGGSMSGILGSLAAGGVGGGGLMAVVGIIKGLIKK